MKKNIYLSVVCAFAINVAASDLGTIQVESSTIDDKYDSKQSEVSSVTIINSEKIKKINPTNVEDVLRTIPGITASNVGNDRVKLHIRGVDNHRYMGEKPGVAVVIDGIPVQETTGKITLDLDNIESIKVIKGGASYLYGNDALSGAVVITTKRPKGKSSSKFETEAGSFGFKRALISTSQSMETSSLQLQATIRDSDGYWDDAYLKHKSVNGKYQYYIDDSSDITYGLDYTKRETGDGTSIHGETASIENPKSIGEVSYSGYYDTELIKTFLTYSNDIDNTSNIMFNISRYQDDTTNRTRPNTTNDDHTTLSDEQWIQNTLKGEYRKSFGGIAIMAGIDISRNTQDNYDIARIDYSSYSGPVSKGTILADSSIDEDVNAFYGELIYKINSSLTTTVNARFDNIEYDYTDNQDSSLNVDPTYNVGSYRAGLNYGLTSKASLYTSFSTGFRTPTAEQISDNQDGISRYPTTDIPSSLDPETTYNYELGIRGNTLGLNYDASIFQIDRKDYLGIKAGSYIWDGMDDEDGYTYNLGDLRSRGFELALNSDKKKMLSFDMAYTYLDAEFTDYSISHRLTDDPDGGGPAKATYERMNLEGNQVPRTPKHTLNFILDYKPIHDLLISTEIVAKDGYYADELNKFKQPGHALINLRGNYNITDRIEIFAKIDNLFDKTYNQFVNVSSSSFDKDMEDATIRVAPPRAYYAGLRAKF